MASISTTDIKLDAQRVDEIVKQVQTTSAVAALSDRKPMRFGNANILTFDTYPKAEFVEEGAEKAPASAAFGQVTAVPHKAQVTVRFNEEVTWAEADYRLGVLDALTDAAGTALSRALDLGVFHRINPSTGAEVTTWTNYLASTTKTVTDTGDAAADIESAIGKVLTDGEGWDVNGIALDKPEAFTLATTKDKQGRLLYPELGYGTGMTSFKGIPARVTTTVNPPETTTKPGIKAIVGDFRNGIYWGVQRELPVERITYGDPDGAGDLKRHNQVAFRVEVVYAWYVFPDRFATVKTAASAG